jgi:hypothetical protein
MPTMLLRSITATTALAAAVAAPAQAAPVLVPLNPCYVAAQEGQREPVTVKGTGFTPFSRVGVYIDNILQDEPLTAVDGSLLGTVRAPWPEVPQRAFVLRVTEYGKPDNSASTTSLVTRLAVSQQPKQASTRRHVRFRGRGFMDPLAPVYAHYVFAGRSRKTVRLGMPTPPCGVFSVRRKQFPFKKRPQVGVWTIQFDQVRRYDPQAMVRVPLTVKVRRQIKPRRAR